MYFILEKFCFTANIGALDSILKPLPESIPEQVLLFEKMCKKLRFGYNVQTFCNPSIQSFYTNLEATVYDEEVEDVEDLTLPNLPHQDEKLGPFLGQVTEKFGSVSCEYTACRSYSID